MAIRHTIRRDGKGNTKTVSLTPIKALRAFCFECVGFNKYEVEKCTAPLCPLYPFRNRGATKGTRPSMKIGVQPPQLAKGKRSESKQSKEGV